MYFRRGIRIAGGGKIETKGLVVFGGQWDYSINVRRIREQTKGNKPPNGEQGKNMTTTQTIVSLYCDTCTAFMSHGDTEAEAIEMTRKHGDSVDTDYTPPKTMCNMCKIEWVIKRGREQAESID